MENNEENREILVQAILDSWDMDTLLDYAQEQLTLYYENCEDEAFQEDWNYNVVGY